MIAEQFEQWMRNKHLEECFSCRKEGKARLMDCNAMAVQFVREFEKELSNKANSKI